MIIGVLGAKGSAVTTTALALATTWPGNEAIVLELDPTGGDLAAWFDLAVSPGVGSLATTRSLDIRSHTHTLPGGLRVIPAPVVAADATGVIGEVVRGVLPLVRHTDEATLFLDLGSGRGSLGSAALAHVDLAVVAVRQDPRSRGATVARCVHAGQAVEAASLAGAPVATVLVGNGPIRTAEINEYLSGGVAGLIDEDPVSAAQLAGEPGSPRRNRRSRLLRSAAIVSASLHAKLAEAPLVDAT